VSERAGLIVVGVDGSDPGRTALRWALAEARLRGARVVAVHVWTYTPTVAPNAFDPVLPVAAPPELDETIERDAHRLLDEQLAAVAEESEGLEVERRVVEGGPADALLVAADGADLLVVGTVGHGGLTGFLFGSVAQDVARHPPCPVVLVPHASSA
jgi:nucleotide-binding universal stress UspA family protein